MISKTRLAAVRSFFALAAIALLTATSAAQTQAPRPTFGPGTVTLPFNKNVWPQTYSDIPADPAIRFGTLPNGMRYALMHNATPPRQASLRLRFDTGSMMERDDQQGLAHFLEHMAFNGSRNVPEGEMVKILERLGLAFGADTNASTGQDETIYQLDLPRTDDETVDTALMLFRETASNLLIAPEAVDRERGVVLSEERSRDSPGYRLYKTESAFVMGDHIAVRRQPIGLPEILRTAPNTAIQDYWRAYYRPERATLVFVGDFDVDAMEAKIRARFADWTGSGPAGADPALALPLRRGPEVKVAVEAGAQQSVSVNWIRPPDLDPDTLAERRDNLVTALGFAVLNRRLERLARSPEAPFLSAGGGDGDYFRSAEIISLSVQPQDGKWREGMTAALLEQRRLSEYGVGPEELNREVQQLRTAVQTAAARAATRQTPALANMIIGSVGGDQVVSSPAQELARLDAMLAPVTVAAVNARMREVFAGSGPLVFVTTPRPIEEAAVRTALTEALATPVQPPQILETKAWPYDNFGTPGRITSEETLTDIDTDMIRFENGVRLTVKRTKFRENQILVSVRVGKGLLSLPTDRSVPTWTLPAAFIDGGLAALTNEEIEQIMNERVVGAGFGIDDDAFTFSGGTRPQDLTIQMQLLAAYVTAPGWRPEPFNRMRAAYATAHDELEQTASDVFSRDLAQLLHSGDTRWAFPSRIDIAGASPSDLRNVIEPQLNNGPIEVIIVGDVNIAEAKAAVAATFGALPARPTPAWRAPPAPSTHLPAPNTTPVVLTHKGRADQAMAAMVWRTDDFFTDMHKARSLRILGEVIRLRLIEELREKQGTTYSPSVSIYASSAFPGFGYAAMVVETPPQNLAGFYQAVETIAADLRANPITADELQRAKAPSIEALDRNFETNGFWLGQLSGAQDDPRRLTALRSARSGIQRVTIEDVQARAREYLVPGQTWKLEVRAQSDLTSSAP